MDPLDTTAYFTQIDSLDSTINASNSIYKSTFAGGNCVAVKTVPRNYTTEPAPLLHECHNCQQYFPLQTKLFKHLKACAPSTLSIFALLLLRLLIGQSAVLSFVSATI
jgi:hypothetical protein